MSAPIFTKKFASALTAAAILAAPLAAAPAHANTDGATRIINRDPGDGATQMVRVNDLNLATEEGQRILEKRVRAAANEVCLYTTTGMVATPVEQQGCVRIALQRSEGQMATAINNARYGG